MPGRGHRRDLAATCARTTRTSARRTRRAGGRPSSSSWRTRSAASFLGCSAGEIAFGPSMTALNFLLTRAFARTLRRGRRSRRDRARPRRERLPLARARARSRHRRSRRRGRRTTSSSTTTTSQRLLSDRTRVVGIPGRGELRGYGARRPTHRGARARRRRARLGGRRPLRAARADRRLGVGRRRPRLLAVQVLRAAHGARVREARAPRVVAAVQGAARGERAGRSPVRARDAASTSSSRASSRPSTTSTRSAGTRCARTSVRSASASSPGFRTGVELYGMPHDGADACRRSASTSRATRRARLRRLLAERDLAVWHGDYYAVETMKHLGLEDGAVRAGIVHYNTEDEVDRLLDGSRRARVKLLLLGGPRFLGRAIADAALAARPRADVLQPWRRRIRSSIPRSSARRRSHRTISTGSQGREWDAVIDTCGYLPRRRPQRRPQALAGSGLLLLRLEHLRVRGLQRARRRGEPARRARRPAATTRSRTRATAR